MWVAVFFGITVAIGLAAYAAWAAYAVAHGAALWKFIVGLPFAYFAVPLFFTSVWVFFGWYWRGPRPAEIEMTLPASVRFFWREYLAIAQAPKMIGFRWLMRDPPPVRAELPVLLLHGIGCNAAVWTGLRSYLEAQHLGPVYALSYGPPFDAIETFAPKVAAKIARIEADTGARQVAIVSHSMGGLVARSYIRQYGGAHVRRLVSLGTPYAGSKHAYLMSGTSLAQMRPGSAYLAALAQPSAKEDGVPIVSLWSWHDSMVTPQESSRLPGHENIVLSGIAHNALLGDDTVHRYVADEIRKARAAAPTSECPASVARTPSARA